jgi:hypothetical protein
MSGEVDTSQVELDRKALEDFAVGNKDLERLAALLDRLNIFEAIGVVRQELRHSDFLAFLLDPRAHHGLADAFIERLLQRAVEKMATWYTPKWPPGRYAETRGLLTSRLQLTVKRRAGV